MFLTLLFQNPALFLAWLLAVFLSLSLHEFSHALMAKARGDRTAEREGRLSLNPFDHIDPAGLIAFLVLGFGWAKPVPYNPYNLKNPKWDSVAIALAGPGMNLIVAILSAFIFRLLLPSLGPANLLTAFLFLLVFLNITLMVFNAVPVHPLDGSKLLFALFDGPHHAALRAFIAVRGPQILLLLAIISIFTPYDPFFFVTGPSHALCSAFVGTNCMNVLNFLFSPV